MASIPTQTSLKPLPVPWTEYRVLGLIALITVVSAFAVYQPSQLYFFGDTWDILRDFHQIGFQEMWKVHNDHFIPLSKFVLYLQFLLFGMNNYSYQVVNILIHAANSLLLYIFAAQLSSQAIPRLFGALFFALSGVHWEVPMWETGQQISLALLFTLLSLILYSRYFRLQDPKMLACTFLSALCACLSMGFGFLVAPLLVVHGIVLGWPLWKRALAISSLLVLALLLSVALLLWYHNAAFGNRGHITSLGRAIHLISWIVTGIQSGLLRPSIGSLWGPLPVSGLFLLTGFVFWRSFFLTNRLSKLLVPTVLMLGCYVLTGVGRLEFGMETAAASRYQYFPMAALALIVVWVAGGVFDVAKNRFPMALFPLTAIVILTIPVHFVSGYSHVRQQSPRLLWGRLAHRFINLTLHQASLQPVPASAVCISPELTLPPSMHPNVFPLRRALPLYETSGVFAEACNIGVRSVLDHPALKRVNLTGVDEGGNKPDRWKLYGSVKSSFEAPPGSPARTIRIELPHAGSAYSFDVPCMDTRFPYTFAASAQLIAGEPHACLRLIFKDLAGNILDVLKSELISSRQFETIIASGYPAPGTAVVGVDFASIRTSSAPVVIMVKDVLLVRHPIFIPMSEIPSPR